MLLVLLVPAFVVLAASWWALRGSLPRLDGELVVPGLSAPARIDRDALGVVTVTAANETDAARALGYVHAQERYFEMDLLRRTAAGELAGLFGPAAVETDRKRRVHRMRARVRRDLARITGEHRGLMQAYVEGVNAGLAGLRTRPWPYLLLRQRPAPWHAEDSALVAHAMYFDLQDAANHRELALWRLRPHLPPALFELLTHDGSRSDAPITGHARGDAVLPGPDAVDLRRLAHTVAHRALPSPVEPGSNNFAVAGTLTRDGRAIVADDMHLGLRAPNIWFRAQLRYPDTRAPNGHVDIGGFTLPGMPVVVVGSNTHVAWGFTNSYGDYLDWKLEPPCTHRPPADCGIRTMTERIRVAGGDDVLMRVEETAWGPVMHREPDGSRLALRWAAHLTGGLTMGLVDLSRAASLDEALHIADGIAIPHQNLLIGDRSGRIAWRLLGALPVRAVDCPTSRGIADPGDIALAACAPWTLDPRDTPVVVDPPAHRLWTANSRVVDGDALSRIGDGGYVLGARAKQIRDALFARSRFDERDLLAIQLDDRALLLQPWWDLMRDVARRMKSPALTTLVDAGVKRPERASPDSVSYRVTRAWRLAVHERIANGLVAPAKAALGASFEMPALPQFEGVAWPLVTQRPRHLLPRDHASWDALFEDAAREVRDSLQRIGPLPQRTWGERNTSAICHPLTRALPAFVKPALCMPAEPLPGDSNMPRVQGPEVGASQRMVVAPGHERDGLIHMPGGQSGHPLSPFWGAGHDDWVHGRPTPFLPGPRRHALMLVPASRSR